MRRASIRILSLVRKELVDAFRQPRLLASLIIGPFLILFVFGLGLRAVDPAMRTALVVSEESQVREQVEAFAEDERERERLLIEAVTSDEAAALGRLREQEFELVIVFPDEVTDEVEESEQAVITIYHNQIDPIEQQAIRLFARSAVAEVNARLLEDVVAALQEQTRLQAEAEPVADETVAGDLAQFNEIDPRVLVSPFRGETQALSGRSVELADFYAPAVVIVLLQHIAVTLLGLSVVRERELGMTELIRASPMRPSEYVLGKYLSHILLGGLLGALLLLGLVYAMGVPLVGAWWHIAVILAALLIASVAVGMVLSLVAQSDSQAVQFAMLLLLATIFLSGFLLSLDRFLPFARPLAWLLPATYVITGIRDVMLRGAPIDLLLVGALLAYGLVFSIIAVVLVRRELKLPTGG